MALEMQALGSDRHTNVAGLKGYCLFIQCICLIDRDLVIKRWGWDLINSFNPVLFFYLNKPQRRCPLASVVVYFVFWGDRFTRGVVYVCYIVDHLFIFNFLIDCWLLNVHWQIFPSYSEREQVQQYMYITITYTET
jgi:hypothetical protein